MDLAYADLPRAPTGRPSKFTPEIVGALLSNLRAGLTLRLACADAGITESTYYEWLERDAAGVPGYSGFSEDVQRARVASAKRHVANIERHSEQEWKASAWLLARTFPEEYAERSSVQVNHTGGPTVNIAVLNMDMLPAIAGLLGAQPAILDQIDAKDVPDGTCAEPE